MFIVAKKICLRVLVASLQLVSATTGNLPLNTEKASAILSVQTKPVILHYVFQLSKTISML